MGLEGIAFFDVHLLDLDVEFERIPANPGDGYGFRAKGFDFDVEGQAAGEDNERHFIAWQERLTADK